MPATKTSRNRRVLKHNVVGGTGLIAALAKDYLQLRGQPGCIQWVCNHSRNTQLALLNGYVDLALTYEGEQEEISVEERWATNAGCMFHDHFCLAGPHNDPANVRNAQSIEEAFEQIAGARALFHSRCDGSATTCKEQRIWQRCHRRPWAIKDDSSWYKKLPSTPAEALAKAASDRAYLLCDRSTLLTQTVRGNVSNLTVFFEPTNRLHPLMNSCYAMTCLYTPPETQKQVSMFLNYFRSPRGQQLVAKYMREAAGLPLFAPVEEGFANALLAGGRAKNNCWTTGMAHL